MAPLPKRRHSSRRQRKRRAKIALNISSLTRCPSCGAKILPHRVCQSCGFYNKSKIIQIKEKAKKRS